MEGFKLGKFRKLTRIGVALILCIVTVFSCSIPVFADNENTSTQRSSGNYKAMAGAMLETFKDGGNSDLDISSITEGEFRTFGVLLSNFLIPTISKPNKLNESVDVGSTKYNAWEQFCKVWNKNSSTDSSVQLSALLSMYEKCFTIDTVKKLYYKDETAPVTVERLISTKYVGAGSAHWGEDEIIPISGKLYWKDGDKEHAVFDCGTYSGKAVQALIRAVNPKGIDDDSTLLESSLCVSAFGDICAIDNNGNVTVIIPACLNSYAFGNSEQKFYMNNAFVLGNFASTKDISETKVSDIQFFSGDTTNLKVNSEALGSTKLNYGSWFSQWDVGEDVNVFPLSMVMHSGNDKFIPFLQKTKDEKGGNRKFIQATAGLTVYGSDNADDDHSFLATQPCWSFASLRWVTTKSGTVKPNVIGVVGRSSALDIVNSDGNNAGNTMIGYKQKDNNNETLEVNRMTHFLNQADDNTPFVYAYNNFSLLTDWSKWDCDVYDYEDSIVWKWSNDSSWGWQVRFKGWKYGVKADESKNKDTARQAVLDSVKGTDTKYVVLYLGGQLKDIKNINGSGNEQEGKSVLNSVCFQIPINKTISKLGVFNTIASNNTADQMGVDDSGNFPISCISYTDDTDDGVLTKIESKGTKYTGKTNREHSDNEVKTIALPESLSVLPSALDFGGDTQTRVSANGINLVTNRSLFANIYWAYIEDIQGIKAEDISKALKEGKEYVAPKMQSFDWLPTIVDSGTGTFADSLVSQIDSADLQAAQDAANQSALEKKQASIIDWVYKILSGGTDEVIAEAGQYVVNWLKSLVDGLFIGMHNSLVGIDVTNGFSGSVSGVGNTNQSGVYSTAVGYITTPTFDSLPITSWVSSNFTLMYVALMLLVSVILIFMVVSRVRQLAQAVGIFIVMAFVLVLPANLLNSSINMSNVAAENIYSEKFIYWAVMQHAEYLVNINSASNSTQANLIDNMSRQSESVKTGGVTLKWLCPKKWGITEQIKSVTKNTKGLGLFLYFAGDVLDGEDYSYNVSSDGVYMYRTYMAIFTEAKGMHEALKANSGAYDSDNSTISSSITKVWISDSEHSKFKATSLIKTDKSNKSKTEDKSIKLTQTTNDDGTTKTSTPNNNMFRITSVRDDTLFRLVLGGDSVGKSGNKSYPQGYHDSYYGKSDIMGVKNPTFNSSQRIMAIYSDSNLVSAVLNFNPNNVSWDDSTKSNKCGIWLSADNKIDVSGQPESNYYTTGIRTFFNYSESPYYYFYNVFQDTLITASNNEKISGNEDFVSLLLSDEFFTVTDTDSKAYGQVKDYLDFEGLFTYIIPFLDYANQDVTLYTDKWGSKVNRNDFTDTTEVTTTTSTTSTVESTVESSAESSGTGGDESSGGTETTTTTTTITKGEQEYEEHKSQLQAVWNMYSPWVNALMDINTTSQKANSGYGQVTILEPCNPVEYVYNNRPMAFSPAESVLRGYEDVDLTTVEYKLQKILKDTKSDLVELLNYKDLTSDAIPGGNDILVSAAAMIATFHFNQEFSDTGFMSTNIQLYPVSFELKNMNYDAYLRLIMGNSMCINQVKLLQNNSTANQTIYEVFIHNTSLVSAIILILVDAMGVFIIPIMKILLIAVIFFLALALSISCIISAPEKMLSTILTTFVLPLMGMIAIFTAHAIVVSWFIGDGASGVIDTRSIAVTTGDPTITLLLLLIVDVVTSILMWKLLKFAAVSTVKYIKVTFNGIKDMAQNVFGNLVGSIAAVTGIGTVAVGAGTLAAKGVGTVAKGIGGTVKAGVAHSRVKTQKKIERNTRKKKGDEENNNNNTNNNSNNSNSNSNSSNSNSNNSNNSSNSSSNSSSSSNTSNGNRSTRGNQSNNSNGENKNDDKKNDKNKEDKNGVGAKLDKQYDVLKKISGQLDGLKGGKWTTGKNGGKAGNKSGNNSNGGSTGASKQKKGSANRASAKATVKKRSSSASTGGVPESFSNNNASTGGASAKPQPKGAPKAPKVPPIKK